MKGKIQNEIIQGNTQKALDLLEQYIKRTKPNRLKDVSIFQSRYHSIKKKEGLGIIDSNEFNRELNKINHAILNFSEHEIDTILPSKTTSRSMVILTFLSLLGFISVLLFVFYKYNFNKQQASIEIGDNIESPVLGNNTANANSDSSYFTFNEKDFNVDIALLDSSKAAFEAYLLKNAYLVEKFEDPDRKKGMKEETLIDYNYTESEDKITIKPNLGYYDRYIKKKEKPLHKEDYILYPAYYSRFFTLFPTLDIKALNNTNKTIFITEAFIDVIYSKPIEIPVPKVDYRTYEELSFVIYNEGWGSMQNVEIEFNVVPKTSTFHYDSEYKFRHYVPLIESEAVINISDELYQLGLDTNTVLQGGLRYLYTDFYLDGPDIKNEYTNGLTVKKFLKSKLQNKLGLFQHLGLKDLDATIYGSIKYNYKSETQTKTNKINFHINIPLIELIGYGGGADAISFRCNSELQLEGDNYQFDVPISRSIKPGDADSFMIKLSTKKSSEHEFIVRFIYSDGNEYSSKPIQLELFVPRLHIEEERFKFQ